ncbi:MAG: dockerin type I domain-containing protein [Planctomycetota bacterium]
MSNRVFWFGFALLSSPAFAGDIALNASFLRGDVNQNARVEVSDAVLILNHLFLGGDERVSQCLDAADVDDNGRILLADPIHLLLYLFQQGRKPAFPFPSCDWDRFRSPDALTCEEYEPCAPDPGTMQLFGETFDMDDASVYFIVDRSGSMRDSGELERAKQELSRAIVNLDDDARFAAMFIDHSTTKFPEDGVPARVEPKALDAALEFIASATGGSGSCPIEGFESAFDYVERSSTKRHLIVYLGDGGGTCRGAIETDYLERMVETVTERNQGRAEIHAIGVLMGEGRARYETYLRELTERNGGRYRRGS